MLQQPLTSKDGLWHVGCVNIAVKNDFVPFSVYVCNIPLKVKKKLKKTWKQRYQKNPAFLLCSIRYSHKHRYKKQSL